MPKAIPDEAMMSESRWNSLEVAKLIASLVTPAAVAILGLYLTLGAEGRDDKRTIAAEVRAQRREDSEAARDFDRQRQLASQAAELTRSLAKSAAERSEEAENRAIARDAAVRLMTEQSSRRSALYQRRAEFWDKFHPSIIESNGFFLDIDEDDTWKDILARMKRARLSLEKSEVLFYIYKPYFEPQYAGDMGMMSDHLEFQRTFIEGRIVEIEGAIERGENDQLKLANLKSNIVINLQVNQRELLQYGAEVIAHSTNSLSAKNVRSIGKYTIRQEIKMGNNDIIKANPDIF